MEVMLDWLNVFKTFSFMIVLFFFFSQRLHFSIIFCF